MDSVATARVNATLDRIRACVSTVANHSDVLRRAVSESTRVVQAMDKEIIASDTEFSKIFITELNDLQEKQAKCQEIQRRTRLICDENEKKRHNISLDADSLQADVDEFRLQRDAIPVEEERLRSSLDAGTHKRELREAHVRQAASRLSNKCEKARHEIEAYEEALAMNVHVVADRAISFSFMSIDPENPDAAYTVTVSTKNGRFKATSCEPFVAEFDALNMKLRESSGLLVFLREMRVAFRNSISL